MLKNKTTLQHVACCIPFQLQAEASCCWLDHEGSQHLLLDTAWHPLSRDLEIPYAGGPDRLSRLVLMPYDLSTISMVYAHPECRPFLWPVFPGTIISNFPLAQPLMFPFP